MATARSTEGTERLMMCAGSQFPWDDASRECQALNIQLQFPEFKTVFGFMACDWRGNGSRRKGRVDGGDAAQVSLTGRACECPHLAVCSAKEADYVGAKLGGWGLA